MQNFGSLLVTGDALSDMSMKIDFKPQPQAMLNKSNLAVFYG